MQSSNSSQQKGLSTDREKKRRSRNITELKAEAKNLKKSLDSLEREKRESKAKSQHLDQLYELCETSGVQMDKEVFQQIIELLQANVHPDNIIEFLRILVQRKSADSDVVSLI